jgi:creatinine amidohydrolase
MALNYLYKMTSTKIKELQPKCNLAFIPLGPTEVHGPHLPLMTDFRSGLELCERAARKLQEEGIESIIATPVTYCAADVTNVFPGNTSLRVETVEMLLEDICLSLARSGFYNIMVVSGHADPGNAAAVVRGIENAKKKNRAGKHDSVPPCPVLFGMDILSLFNCPLL